MTPPREPNHSHRVRTDPGWNGKEIVREGDLPCADPDCRLVALERALQRLGDAASYVHTDHHLYHSGWQQNPDGSIKRCGECDVTAALAEARSLLSSGKPSVAAGSKSGTGEPTKEAVNGPPPVTPDAMMTPLGPSDESPSPEDPAEGRASEDEIQLIPITYTEASTPCFKKSHMNLEAENRALLARAERAEAENDEAHNIIQSIVSAYEQDDDRGNALSKRAKGWRAACEDWLKARRSAARPPDVGSRPSVSTEKEGGSESPPTEAGR